MAFSKVCVAVLAAGQSQRMGFPKLIEPFAGTTLLDRALDAALGCAADVACVVLSEGMSLDDTALEKARAQNVCVLKTDRPTFETALAVQKQMEQS